MAAIPHVIVLLGNNDIIVGNVLPGEVVTSAEVVQAHRMLIARARAQGLTVYGGTLPAMGRAIDLTLFKQGQGRT